MWDDVRLYELELNGYDDDLGFWVDLISRYEPASVLELACGTGRITLPMAVRGCEQRSDFRIAGIDSSAEFIARAQELRQEQEPAVQRATTFAEGDMRNIDLGETFDLIALGFNSFAYLHTIDDHLACLDGVRRHLAPGGHFILDVIVPQFNFVADAQVIPPVIRLELNHPVPEAGIERFLRSYTDRYDGATQTITTTYFYEIYHEDGRQERTSKDLAWHMFYPHELELLLRQAGFRIIERHGDYNRSPFTSRSKQYVWTMLAE
jgi:SAM-dependent methyltransferase